ncbi:hypothetical protein HYALB_00005540 [Hymenoscyphus albidus]|uniref:FAD-binding domain-containing protein n=1 Tax=Hymenoscyphus albidus TaxID=595503 RepID=A0A9N9LZ09_9HELO|nr:hypothetical protein HYALB_00005540 [Hymenoscyphus albidus]
MNVLIIGAGPSGLILALLLAKSNIKVTLLDAATTIDDRPRAAHYSPSAIRTLRKAGVLDDVRAEGIIPGDFNWRRQDLSLVTGLKDTPESRGEDGLTCLPLNLLGKVLLRHVVRTEGIELRWKHKVRDVGQDGKGTWAVAEVEGGEVRIEGDYLVGCDGANSRVRTCLFGESFPGHTWDAQIVATDVYYDLHKHGMSDINNIIHPQDYYMAAILTRAGLWRVSYGEDPSFTHEQVLANQPAKYERMLPGNPKPGDYQLMNVAPYRIHQRCAEKMRVGKILLAADAAHLVNPFGGLGLTGGIVDVDGLAQCLEGIEGGCCGEEILERRVSKRDPVDPFKDDPFLRYVREMELDTTGEMRKEFNKTAYDICHDFTQYYTKSKDGKVLEKERDDGVDGKVEV